MIPVLLSVDRSSTVALQRQIFNALRAAIADGTLKADTRLPSTRELASRLRVSRNSVVNAFRYLAAQGLIYTRQGGGTRVASAEHLHQRVARSADRSHRRGTAGMRRRVVDVSLGRAGAFSPGVGPIDLFPLKTWKNIASKVWRRITPVNLAYEPGNGDPELREMIAAYVGIARGIRCDKEQVIVVSGAQQAIDFAARVLLEPGDVACVEDPGYFGARGAFSAAGARIVAAPLNAEGLDVEAARSLCAAPRLIYVTAAHQYPTGVVMSLHTRCSLLQWARTTGAWIIDDGFGGDFRYGGEAIRELHTLDQTASVIHIGSFSELLAPALRFGYLIIPQDLLPAFAATRAISGRATPAIDQIVLARFIAEGHLSRHLRRAHEACSERQDLLLAALSRVNAVIGVSGTSAGTHLVAHLKETIDDIAVSRRARQLGIEALALRLYASSARLRPALVLGYGSTDRAAIDKGVTALRSALDSRRR